MKKNLRFQCLLPFLLAFFCFSCIEIDVKTAIEPDGKGSQVWKFSTTALLSQQLRKQVESSPLFKKKNIRITDEYKEGDYVLTAEIPFDRVHELSDEWRDLRLEKSGFFVQRYVFTETWKKDLGIGGLLSKQAGSLVPVNMKVSVQLPGKIVESNASSFEGDTARWSIALTELAASPSIHAVSRRWNLVVIVGFIVTCLILVVGIGMWIISRKENTPVSPRCSACGAMAPPGSSFCNSCGNKF